MAIAVVLLFLISFKNIAERMQTTSTILILQGASLRTIHRFHTQPFQNDPDYSFFKSKKRFSETL